MRTTLTLLAFLPLTLLAQTNWAVEVGGSLLDPENLPYYDPMELMIQAGDEVTWTNVSGSHNVFGALSEFPDNPEGFLSNSSTQSGGWVYSHTFNIPGVYNYHCTGSFQGQLHSTTQHGMITVLDANSIQETSPWGELNLYPVPVTTVLNVGMESTERLTLELFAPDGRLVRTTTTNMAATTVMDMSNEAPGLYMLRMVDQQGRMVTRAFVKD